VPVKEKPEDALAPYLASEQPRDNGDIDAHCPLHHDRKRSAVINFDEGVWYCNTEGIGGSIDDLMESQADWVDPPEGGASNSGGRRKVARPAEELPTDEDVERWKVILQHNEIALEDIKAARGIWTKTADYFELGWDPSANCYTMPVRDEEGEIVNVRRYQLRPPAGRRKIWGVTGHNGAVLYPWSALKKAQKEGSIIVCEGELDAIICNQYNFRAVTRTSSARSWKAEWNKLFKGMTVYVCHDCDSAGQAANRKVARNLSKVAKEVRIVRLPYTVTPDHGKDLTDWWLEHDSDSDAFQRLLDEAVLFDETVEDPEEIDPSPASVVDAFDSRKTGKPLALTVTVKGRREPGYSVPRKIEFRCTMDHGKVCAVCPMKAEDGEQDRIIAGADPLVLEMIESPKAALGKTLRGLSGAPKDCPKLRVTVAEHQAVEVLYARPSVEHSNGGGNADYKNIKLTSVGRHDTSPNQTIRVVGALYPGPRTQTNEFLTWDLSRLETSLDRFELTGDIYEQLKVFQPRPNQKPLGKIRDIADDLAAHVTQIYGRPELHAMLDLVWHSVVSFDFSGKRLVRGWLDGLVVGDTRTGKSETATRLTKFYQAGEVVSCESASFAGILGGLQQMGGAKEWAITWGAIPINDRRLVVLDEISGLTPEDIGALSSVRSSGLAELTKIQQERTHARTRLIWIGNPRNARMSDYTYGVQAIRPLIGNAEDIARFDLAMSVSSGDIRAEDINRSHEAGPQKYSREACQALVRWAWSRTPDQIIWGEGAEDTVFKAALDLGSRYTEDPPLIQAANVREKVARIAVAIAARLFSTDERGEMLIVRSSHVKAAVQFLDRLYSMKGFGYAERSKEYLDDRRMAENPKNIKLARRVLTHNAGLDKFLRAQGKFRRQDLEEILDIDREEANAIISELYRLRMLYKVKGDVLLTPTLHNILRGETIDG
jgi:hypothetical protein